MRERRRWEGRGARSGSAAALVGGLWLLVACGADDRGAAAADRGAADRGAAREPAAAAAGEVAQVAGETAETLVREAAGGGGKVFELRVEAEGLDLPVVEGASVMATTVGGRHTHYSFFVRGSTASASMALADTAKDAPGTYDPVNLGVIFLEEKISCGYSSVGGRSGAKLTVTIVETATGIRGEIAGDVGCRPLERETEGGPWPGRIEGWFER